MTKQELKIKQLKKELFHLEPMLPGSLNKQWNICGTPGCRCKDPKEPLRHGPYYQLSFSIQGKSSSFFVKKEDVQQARKRIVSYQQFKRLSLALTQAYVQLARETGLSRSLK